MNYNNVHIWLKNSQIWFLLILSIVLSACGGGTSDNSASAIATDNGTLLIAVTDAEGDFISYSVDVLSIKMTHSNGRVIETLPQSSRVDFAEYTNLTEFITAATVPTGRYVQGSMVLDFTNADIWVEDAAGKALQVTRITDVNGDVVTTMEVSVNLEGQNALPIAVGIAKHLTLDFDLKASNTVTVATTGASIIVEPNMVASIDLIKSKQHRLRGPLKAVDVDAGSFELLIRPFRHRLVGYKKHFGALTVQAGDKTQYEIDGIAYQGAAGLSVLAALAELTGVIVHGSIKFKPLRFEAELVYAGSSVAGGNLDVVQGSVISRTANVIKVQGARVMRSNGKFVFNDAITILLADSTVVKRQLSMADFSIADVSVGSRVTVFGTVTNESAVDYVFDATSGFARIRLSTIKGTVTNSVAQANQLPILELKLRSINGRTTRLYNFSGTGIATSGDSVAGQYEIETSRLNLPNFDIDTRLAVRGFVSAFGTAPKDFNAQTVIEQPAVVATSVP